MKQNKSCFLKLIEKIFILFFLVILGAIIMPSCNPSDSGKNASADSTGSQKIHDTSKIVGPSIADECPFTTVKFDQGTFKLYYDNSDLFKMRFIPYLVNGETEVRLYGMALSKNDTTSIIDPPFILPLGPKIQDPRKSNNVTLYEGLVITKTDLDGFMSKITTSFDLELRPNGCTYQFFLNGKATGHNLNPSPPGLE